MERAELRDVVERVLAQCAAERRLGDSELQQLTALFGPVVLRNALEAVCDKRVRLLCSPRGRRAYRFQLAQVATLCFLLPHPFCSCNAYAAALRTEKAPVCLHLLAVYIARLTDTFDRVDVPDAEFAKVLLQSIV